MTQALSSRYGTKHQRESENPELLTTDQLCRWLQIHPITAVIWRRQGRGPAFIDATDARFIRYLRTKVLAWLEQNRHDTPADNNGRRKMHSGTKAPAKQTWSRKSNAGGSNGAA
jgi:hypothetical protein